MSIVETHFGHVSDGFRFTAHNECTLVRGGVEVEGMVSVGRFV